MNNWFDTTFSVARNEWIEASDGTKLVTESIDKADVDGNLQQASPEFAEAMQLEFRKTFILYTTYDADIQEADMLTTGGDTYTVKGVQRFSHEKVGNPHTKAVLQK